ncbi:hypothetical protein EVAR_55358_1 [Eumeta japonica]|uniref:Uncharacterized protein n=1 Tax=Eumeta variegata TaxID=151549 RepID=A0A4C1YVQ5_EUMVA|nr:hypothetical protein EVAR_55358_1 [Eumeta japonica]
MSDRKSLQGRRAQRLYVAGLRAGPVCTVPPARARGIDMRPMSDSGAETGTKINEALATPSTETVLERHRPFGGSMLKEVDDK